MLLLYRYYPQKTDMDSKAKCVFECLEMRESIIKQLDTMQQLYYFLCIQELKTLKEHSAEIEKIKLSKAYISTDVCVYELKIIDLIRDEKWLCILEKWGKYMINPEVAISTLNALSSCRHDSNSPVSFVQSILSELNSWTVAAKVVVMAEVINYGLLDLVAETMRKHCQNHTIVMASIVFLMNWFMMINRVDKECRWQLKIVSGIVKEIEDENNGTPSEEWFASLVESETGEDLPDGEEEEDRFFEPYNKIKDTVEDFVEEYQEESSEIDLKDSEKAQHYMDQCMKNIMVYRTVDLRPIVCQVMQWLRTITQQELPEHGRKQIRALALLQTALKTNHKMRAGLIEYGIVPFVVSRIAFNNGKAMLIRKRKLDAQVPCEYTPCQFAYYSLLYELLMKTDNDVLVAALSKASAVTVILDTLHEASMMNSPFVFEFAGKERRDVYYVEHMNCYKTMKNGVPVHNISELALVVMSKMCIPNRFTIDLRYYKENIAYFRKHSDVDLLRMGLFSFTNIEQSVNAQHNSISDDDHDERLRNLSNLESMVLNPKSEWMVAHSERKKALLAVVTEEMEADAVET